MNSFNQENPKKRVFYKDASPLLRDLLKKSSVWEISLDALLGIKHKAPQEAVKEYDSRMVWFIDFTEGRSCHAKPREQKRQANGKWTKGRPIALKRLSESLSSFPYLTRQDKEICSHIYEHSYASGRYTNYEYLFDDKYIFSLIGHPLLFLDDGITQVELTTGKPELVVQTKKNNDISIELRPKPSSTFTRDYYTLQETPTRLKIIRTSDEFQRIAKIIGKGLVVPSSAKKEAIDSLAGDITILSDFR